MTQKRCDYCKLIGSHWTSTCHLSCDECGGKYHTADRCMKDKCRRCKIKGHKAEDCTTEMCDTCGSMDHKTESCFKDKTPCSHCWTIRGYQYNKTKSAPTLKAWFMYSHLDDKCPNVCHWCKTKSTDHKRMYTHKTQDCRFKSKNFT